jgi:hypothetical protein
MAQYRLNNQNSQVKGNVQRKCFSALFETAFAVQRMQAA